MENTAQTLHRSVDPSTLYVPRPKVSYPIVFDPLLNNGSAMLDVNFIQGQQHMGVGVEQLQLDDAFLQLLAGEDIDDSLFEGLDKSVENTAQTHSKFDSAHYVPAPDVGRSLLSWMNSPDEELSTNPGFYRTSNPLPPHSFWRTSNPTEAKKNDENKRFDDSLETTSTENISSNPTQKKI